MGWYWQLLVVANLRVERALSCSQMALALMVISSARHLSHPFQLPPTEFPPVDLAFAFQSKSAGSVNEQRSVMMGLVSELADMVFDENARFLEWLDVGVKQVLMSGGLGKNIVAMRELSYICRVPDWGAIPALCLGQSMVGWADAVPFMLPRINPPRAAAV